jgi:hypothetical protein
VASGLKIDAVIAVVFLADLVYAHQLPLGLELGLAFGVD